MLLAAGAVLYSSRSIRPAENENPRWMSSRYAIASDSPVSTAWMT